MHKCGKQIKTDCSIAIAAKIVGDVWTILIIRDLLKGKKRFKDFEESLHTISTKTLSQRLVELEKNKLIKRSVYNETPPRVEYELTEHGKQLQPIIQSLEAFGRSMAQENEQGEAA